MIQARCPICSKQFDVAALDDLPTFPFCSERCRLIDLGRWIDGAYTLPADKPAAEATDDRPPTDVDVDDES
jgi:endogenous inhibitor of DNA gyrase (YacG/DUF329 family)